MVKREQYTISLSEQEAQDIRDLAQQSGETFSGYIRRQMLNIVAEEKEQDFLPGE